MIDVIPAKAGIQAKYTFLKCDYSLDPLLQGDDKRCNNFIQLTYGTENRDC